MSFCSRRCVPSNACILLNENLTALEAAARAALAGQSGRTLVFDYEGQRYVIKRLAEKPRRLIQTLFMRWLVKRLTGQPLPMQTLALADAAGVAATVAQAAFPAPSSPSRTWSSASAVASSSESRASHVAFAASLRRRC